MLQQDTVPDELKDRCQAAADQVLRDYGWQLITRDELVRRAVGLLCAGHADRPVNAAVGAYCTVLYSACSGDEGLVRQNQAFAELARYLYMLVCVRFADLAPDVREDVTQSALERIFRSLQRCHEPVAFLAFAAQHLLDAARMARRHAYRPVESLDQAARDDERAERPSDELTSPQLQPPEQMLLAERRTSIDRLLYEFVADHPRAAQQIAVLRMTWLDDMDDSAISRLLCISLSSVYAARSRAIKTMQSEPKWHARARALGLLSDEL